MSAVANTPIASNEIQVHPHIGKQIGSYARALYNYDVTATTTNVSLDIIKSQSDERAKARYIVINFRITVANLSAFVKEVHDRQFNPNNDPETIKSSIGRIIATALFITMIYCAQAKKALGTVPILVHCYDLGHSAYKGDFWKGIKALENIADAALGDTVPLAITDGSEQNSNNVEESQALQITVIITTEDEPREDLP